MPGVTLHLTPPSLTTQSDESGAFRFSGLTSSNYTLSVSSVGYASQSLSVTLRSSRKGLRIRLKPSVQELGNVVVQADQVTFRKPLSDNVRLVSISVDIHHNFDHHTHSTEVVECAMEPVKPPVNPFLLIKSFPIPEGQQQYQTAFELAVPANVDPGEYHFMIRLTDQEGWQTVKGLSIKLE